MECVIGKLCWVEIPGCLSGGVLEKSGRRLMAENTGHYFEYLIFKCKYLQAIGSSNHLDIEFNSVTTHHERLEASGNSVKEPEFHKSTRLFLNNSSLLSRRTWRLEIGCWDLKVIEPKVWGLEKVNLQGCKESFNDCSITCVLLAPFQGVDCGPWRRIFVSLSLSPPAVSKEGNNFQGSQFQALRRLQFLLGRNGRAKKSLRGPGIPLSRDSALPKCSQHLESSTLLCWVHLRGHPRLYVTPRNCLCFLSLALFSL